MITKEYLRGALNFSFLGLMDIWIISLRYHDYFLVFYSIIGMIIFKTVHTYCIKNDNLAKLQKVKGQWD